MEETLKARTGMLRSLAFEAVGQEQHQPTEPLPFGLRAGDELVHYRLSAVPEITVLRFPQNQPVRIIEAVTVFKAQHHRFGKGAVADLNRGLLRRQVLERRVGAAILEIVQDGVALAEGAAFGILAGEAHAKAPTGQAGERQRLCRRPVQRLLSAGHSKARLQEFLDFWMRTEILWKLGLCRQPGGKLLWRNPCLNVRLGWFGSAQVLRPHPAELVGSGKVFLRFGFGQ